MGEKPFRPCADGLLLAVRLTPRASRDGIDGLASGEKGAFIQARVRAVPEDGKANEALIDLLAKDIGVRKSSLRIASGASARVKSVHFAGAPAELESKLVKWLERFT